MVRRGTDVTRGEGEVARTGVVKVAGKETVTPKTVGTAEAAHVKCLVIFPWTLVTVTVTIGVTSDVTMIVTITVITVTSGVIPVSVVAGIGGDTETRSTTTTQMTDGGRGHPRLRRSPHHRLHPHRRVLKLPSQRSPCLWRRG